MYDIEIYETPAGNRPFQKYIESITQKHKDDDYFQIFLYLNKLKEYGFEINNKFKKNSIKLLQDQIYELRPSTTRVFFFYYDRSAKFVILHAYEKKTNKTDQNEIRKAIREKNNILKRG